MAFVKGEVTVADDVSMVVVGRSLQEESAGFGAARLRGLLRPGAGLPDDQWKYHHDIVSVVLAVLSFAVPAYGAMRGFGLLHVLGHSAPLILLTLAARSPALRRGLREIAAALGLMTASALVVHAANGATEAHFMFFALLPFMAVYASRIPFLVAVVYVAVHHFVLGLVAPGSVFEHDPAPLPMASLHAAFILVESFACLVARRLFEDRRKLVESLVVERTAELRRQRDVLTRQAAAIAATEDAVIETSLGGVITGWNRGAERLYGYADADALGAHVTMLLRPESLTSFGAAMAELSQGRSVREEGFRVRKDGSLVATSVTVSNVKDDVGHVIALVDISRDMGERDRAEEQLRAASRQLETQADQLTRLAFHDPLTGLGNRTLFRQRLDQLTAPAGRGVLQFPLLVLDLDDFKLVNDSLGHTAGDELLVAAADRLRDVVGADGTVVRLGGDEFAVLLYRGGEAEAVAVGEQVLTEFYRQFLVLGHELHVTASVGITLGHPGADPADLLRNADLAMYAAKLGGKGKLAVYHPDMLVAARQRLDLENHLRHALERGEIHLAYQPIVGAATGELHSVEALMRWQHPEWGAVPPGAFIPVAETSGMISALGAWALHRACRDACELAEQHGRAVRMSVNVSARQLQSPDFATTVRAALEDAGLQPSLLCLEVTEGLLMDDDHRTLAVLRELHGLGVQLSIDDFGTGHSSLARLRTLPFAELKIDRSFISEISDDGDCGPIVTAIIAMARALGLSVVAEGVETPVQLEALQRLGCDTVQGFLIGRPGPLHAVQLESPGATGSTIATAQNELVDLVMRLRAYPSSDAGLVEPVVSLVRNALAELLGLTGLDTIYLTRVDLDAEVQQVVLSCSRSDDLVPEGLVLAWRDTVCKQAVEVGPTYTTNVPACFADSPAAQELGLMTYVSVALRDSGGKLVGTLCGAAREAKELTCDARTMLEIFAHVITPQLA